MDENDIELALKAIITEISSIPAEEIKLDTKFEEDLNFDDLDTDAFVIEVKDKFSIDFTDKEISKATTFGRFFNLVKDKVDE